MVSKTITRIRSEGYDALAGALEPEDVARFIRSYDPGCDDHTKEGEDLPEPCPFPP